MSKPRIVLADPDPVYLAPLQLRFITEFYEKLEIEVITSKQYYDQLFSTPQKIDILVVAEDFYSYSLSKCDISNIFVLTEHRQATTEKNKEVWLYKYSSITEIFSSILGQTVGALKGIESSQKTTQIITVYSATGGAGKTTLALGIGAVLAKHFFKRVLYLNASRMQTFQVLLADKAPLSNETVLQTIGAPCETAYSIIKQEIRNEIINYIPPYQSALMSYGISYAVFKDIVVSARDSKDYDYIIVDADSVLDDDKIQLFDISDKVLIITRNTKCSIGATEQLLFNIDRSQLDKYLFICNDIGMNSGITGSMISEKSFEVAEYVKHFVGYDAMSIADFSEEMDINRIAYLVL